ncbi:MAG: urea ABC transporter permease subunit UrtB, partial [Magnetospiraceae bacterium]
FCSRQSDAMHAVFFKLTRISIALAVFVLLSGGAMASVEDDVAGLNAKGFAAKIAAVEALANSGDDRVAAPLNAMLEGDLYAWKTKDDQVVIAKRKGKIYIVTDPLTGAELGTAENKELGKIRINNRLRGVLRGAIGGLELMSADPNKRRDAADAVFKARNAEMAPMLEKALDREEDAGVHERMELALAAVKATTSDDETVRLAAIAALGEFAEPEVRSLLGGLTGDSVPPAIQAAATEALDSIERRLALWETLANVFQGISLGSVLLLAAVGLAITFGVMGVINMAHGELVMLGAYTTYMVQEVIRNHYPELFDYSLFIAVPAAFVVAGCAGMAIERGIIRWLYGRPLETLLATWGLSLILQQTVRSIFGPTNREVGTPSWMSGYIEVAGGLTLTYNRIAIIVFSLLVLAALGLVLRKTAFGLQMRAVTQNRRMAGAMGIRTGAVDMMTFGLGAGIAGMAGVALSQIDNVSPNLGQAYIIDSFMVVVFGGVGNLWGTLVGAFSLGLVNKFLEPYAGAVLGKIIVLVVIILFIQKRPRGLFALKGRAVES